MTATEIATLAAQVGQALLSFALLTFLPAALRFARDRRTQATFAAVTRAAKVGALAAAKATRDALDAAKAPSSPGGTTITPAELQAALRTGVEAGKQALAAQAPGLVDEALRIYGGGKALDDAMGTLVTTMARDHSP